MATDIVPGFTYGSALAMLLTTESLLFASFSLAVSLSGPSPRVRKWLVPAPVLVGLAVAAIWLVAIGGLMAWLSIFIRSGFPEHPGGRIIAVALCAAISLQPALAALLASGLRSRR